MHRRRPDSKLAERKDFAFETTLSGYGYIPLLEAARGAGYRIRLDFLWIASLDVARERIRQRVRKGGHDIPDDVQQRRFAKGILMLVEHYRPLLDHWRLFDNTGDDPHLIAEEKDGAFTAIDAVRIATVEQMANLRLMPEVPPRAVEEPATMMFSDETRAAMRAMRRAYPALSWRIRRSACRSSSGAKAVGWSRCRRSCSRRWRAASWRPTANRCPQPKSAPCSAACRERCRWRSSTALRSKPPN